MKIVITGGSRGIGKAITEKFVANNFDVAYCSRKKESLEALQQNLQLQYPNQKIFAFTCDMSVKADVLNFAKYTLEHLGTPDIIVNNAGVFIPGAIHSEADGILEQQINTNLYSAYYFTKALLPSMMKRKSGQIFNICSIASLKAYPNGGSYSISKFALLGFSKCLREEMKPFGIKVCSVMPGATLTDSWGEINFPKERLMSAEDIAQSIFDIYSLSDRTVVEDIVLRPQLGDL